MHLEKETVSYAWHQVQVQKAEFENQLSMLRVEGDATRIRIMQKFTTAKSHLEAVGSDESALENFINDLVGHSRDLHPHLEPIATILIYLQEGSVQATGSDRGSSTIITGGRASATAPDVPASTMGPASSEPRTVGGGSTQPGITNITGAGGGGGSMALLRFCTLLKMEDWRAKLFEELDPWAVSRVSMTFIRQTMEGFEFIAETKPPEVSTASAQCLVDLCEAIIEVNASFDEISELDTKARECELVLDAMMEEERQLSLKESALARNIDATASRGKKLNSNMEDLLEKANEVQCELERAATISKSLKLHLTKWEEELKGCIQQKESLVAKEALTAATKLYLLLLPLQLRNEAFEKIQGVIGFSDKGHCDELINVHLNPWNCRNMVSSNFLPGWAESLVERVSLVYDPNNLLPFLLRARQRPNYMELNFSGEESFPKIDMFLKKIGKQLNKRNIRLKRQQEDLYTTPVEEEEDDASVFATESDFDIIILQASQPALADFVRDRIVPGMRVYLVTSTRQCPIPSGILFVNLSLTSEECRSMLLNRKMVTTHSPPPRPLQISSRHTVTEKERELIALVLDLSISSTDIKRLQQLIASERMVPLDDSDDSLVAAEVQPHSADAVMTETEEEDVSDSERQATSAAGASMAAAILGACQDMNSLLNRNYISVSKFIDRYDAISVHAINCQRPELQLLKQMSLQYPFELLDLFKFLVGLHKFAIDNELKSAEVQDLYIVCSEMKDNFENGHGRLGRKPMWCKSNDWLVLCQISHPKNANWVRQNMSEPENEEKWRLWYTSETWEPPPELKSFGSLLLSFALKMDYATKTFSHFLQVNCPEVLTIPYDTIILQEELILSDKTSPICFLLRGTDDPSEEIQKLARHVGLTDSKLKCYALDGSSPSDSNETMAIESLLHTAGVRGQWLVLQNIEQNKSALTSCLEYLNEAGQKVHKDFRLWLTVKERIHEGKGVEENEGDNIIEDFLQRCIIILCQDRKSWSTNGSGVSGNDPLQLKDQFKCRLKTLHNIYNCLYWDKVTPLPQNRMLSLFDKSFDDSLPNLKNGSVKTLIPEICNWLLHYIYLPYVYKHDDEDQIRADILEITQTIGELYGNTCVPPEGLCLVNHLKTPQFVEVIQTKEQSRLFSYLLQKLLVGAVKEKLIRSSRTPMSDSGGDTYRRSLIRVLRICQGKEAGDIADGRQNCFRSRLAAIELGVLSGTLESHLLRASHLEHILNENLITLLESKARALRSPSSIIDLSLFSSPSIPLCLVSLNAYRNADAKLQNTYKGTTDTPGETSLDVGPLEPGVCYDILIELHEEQDEVGRHSLKDESGKKIYEGERQNELFSGISLYGGFWISNAEGLCVDFSRKELQDLGTVRLSPVLRSKVSTITHMHLPVLAAKTGKNVNGFWVSVRRPLNGVAEIEVRRNVKFIVRDFLHSH